MSDKENGKKLSEGRQERDQVDAFVPISKQLAEPQSRGDGMSKFTEGFKKFQAWVLRARDADHPNCAAAMELLDKLRLSEERLISYKEEENAINLRKKQLFRCAQRTMIDTMTLITDIQEQLEDFPQEEEDEE